MNNGKNHERAPKHSAPPYSQESAHRRRRARGGDPIAWSTTYQTSAPASTWKVPSEFRTHSILCLTTSRSANAAWLGGHLRKSVLTSPRRLFRLRLDPALFDEEIERRIRFSDKRFSVVNPGSEPWTGPAGGSIGQQSKTCPFRNSKTQPTCDTFAERTVEKCRGLGGSPDPLSKQFPESGAGGAGTAIRTQVWLNDAARICLSDRTM